MGFPRDGMKRTLLLSVLVLFAALSFPQAVSAESCANIIKADVVALDQLIFLNRFGAAVPNGMIYALRKDVVSTIGGDLTPGNVMLREDKRPRPLVLRMNAGDCLDITFTNLLAPAAIGDQPATRQAGIHVNGLHLVTSILDDGSNVGTNDGSLAAPGETAVYTLFAKREGTHLLYSTGAMTGGEGDAGSATFGLFGAVNVEPGCSEWYRSQVTRAELDLAADANGNGVLDPEEMTADGHPLINYDAVYPAGHPFEGTPILKMLDSGNNIVHSDLTAIITGPGRGNFPAGTYRANPALPNRNQPFREFTIILHDEVPAVQAFEEEFNALEFTLHGIKDGMGINYGSAGLVSILLANRLGVGPNWNCHECLYEEMSFISWGNGDPAMVVDNPANSGEKAAVALYPDDPSNVYHSYLNDHVKFRNLSAGKEHHIFHLHNHQWLFNPEDDNSTYLDSQAIGPGASYTYEIVYNGGGNRNKSYADSIFHCHFYPHFAQGMWSLWRVHDMFEQGTELDDEGMPVHEEDGDGNIITTARALPDGEILTGTPIPALVPIPGLAMAPMPAPVQLIAADLNNDTILDSSQLDLNGDKTPDYEQVDVVTIDKNPGYPFYMPGVAGHYPPMAQLGTLHDGGLPRHVMADGASVFPALNRLDFTKDLTSARAFLLPEEGTLVEDVAMSFHETLFHPTFKPNGTAASYEANGLARVRGAPFADPCRNDNGTSTLGDPLAVDRRYKSAVIEHDIKLNKAGWHYPSSIFYVLAQDVPDILSNAKPPEPLIIRANSGECVEYQLTNLTPLTHAQDDFQVAHDIQMFGQHIHLVKFDTQASNGGSVGFNYEDSPKDGEAVLMFIGAINAGGGIITDSTGATEMLDPNGSPNPLFPDTVAQTVAYRWYADPLLNKKGVDRTLGNVFTHDHMNPSTIQQLGLYATLIIEPAGSTWRNPETGGLFGTGRDDGGPTSWRADIIPPNANQSFREFVFMFADFQPAYTADEEPVNPPGKVEVGLPFLLAPPDVCPGGEAPPCPEAISAEDPGTFSVNYRNEPIALRVRDPNTNTQAAGLAGDLSFAFQSRTDRADPALNVQPAFYPPLTKDVGAGDPFTPLLRVYNHDRVRIRLLTGAQEEGHNATIHGVRWLQEFASPNSGYRNSQMMGISEQFIFEVPLMPPSTRKVITDYLWTMDASADGYWNGIWGLMRSYSRPRPDLLQLPNNPIPAKGIRVLNANEFVEMCPRTAPLKQFSVSAISAAQALPEGALIYNSRAENGGPLEDPTAILYVRDSDLEANGQLKADAPREPLILRANAGDCIELTLRNKLPAQAADVSDPATWGFSTLPMIINEFNSNQVAPSHNVGLHPQLLEYDVSRRDGANVGRNQAQTVPPNPLAKYTYGWYAGKVDFNRSRRMLVATPVEFGATNLISSDRIKHSNKGAIGALIIEPRDAVVTLEPGTYASATVSPSCESDCFDEFREFVLLFQNDVNLRFGSDTELPSGAAIKSFNEGDAVPNTAEAEDPEDSGQKALNYRTEPMWFRLGFAPDTPLSITRDEDFSNALSNGQIGGLDPETPVFTACLGKPARFRVLEPGGHPRNHVFTLHGHSWQREPYIENSTKIGQSDLSFTKGAQEGHGPSNHFDFVLCGGAGGQFSVPGDYLYRDNASFGLDGGLWGILRVND